MRVIYSEDHKFRDAKTELHGGELVRPFEGPFRAEWILAALKEKEFSEIVAPEAHDLSVPLKLHDAGYLEFLETVWERWIAAGFTSEAIPISLPVRRSYKARPPRNIDGLLGYYANSVETSITEGTYRAAIAAKDCALSGADHLAAGNRFAFSLCRPPGHHAGIDLFGGYCFLNNAAIAAQRLLDKGAGKVAILDVDFHHGNGTQDVTYERDDIFFASLHGDPDDAFPYFWGHAEETGRGRGEGFNANFPMPAGTAWPAYREALAAALGRIADFGAEALIVSLGVDTFEKDPISFFRLKTPDYLEMGRMLAATGLPALTVMEGGYGVPEIGYNVANVLIGIEAE
ncbi:histone deacetylase family protein [Martelella endophytica]|uniref:Acetylpolyamine aminohydrolase n=1 Tax=Martelella endophytica TaxID=1486262 RepID=A0A0D5LPP7_MAREN|nr:histone deacetylase family protein [Martelella endophytica]AJY46204.1 acetylpolyamine aminohydrolase [Martelella endophytica]